MKIKKIFTLSILLNIFFFIPSYSLEYNCKLIKTYPETDFNQLLKIKEFIIDVDFQKRSVKYTQMLDIKIYELKFNNNLATWLHTFINPDGGQERITYSYFDKVKKEFTQNTFPNKNNLKKEDLVLRTEFKCD